MLVHLKGFFKLLENGLACMCVCMYIYIYIYINFETLSRALFEWRCLKQESAYFKRNKKKGKKKQ